MARVRSRREPPGSAGQLGKPLPSPSLLSRFLIVRVRALGGRPSNVRTTNADRPRGGVFVVVASPRLGSAAAAAGNHERRDAAPALSSREPWIIAHTAPINRVRGKTPKLARFLFVFRRSREKRGLVTLHRSGPRSSRVLAALSVRSANRRIADPFSLSFFSCARPSKVRSLRRVTCIFAAVR